MALPKLHCSVSKKIAGLDSKVFNAKMFRCSGATAAVQAGINAEIIRKLGRWKTSFVFYETYVRSITPKALVEAIIPKV